MFFSFSKASDLPGAGQDVNLKYQENTGASACLKLESTKALKRAHCNCNRLGKVLCQWNKQPGCLGFSHFSILSGVLTWDKYLVFPLLLSWWEGPKLQHKKQQPGFLIVTLTRGLEGYFGPVSSPQGSQSTLQANLLDKVELFHTHHSMTTSGVQEQLEKKDSIIVRAIAYNIRLRFTFLSCLKLPVQL